MIKIVKTIALAIKQGDILFDLHPEIHPGKTASFEVLRFNTGNGKIICKALNKRAELYFEDENNEYPFLIESSIDWYKLEVEV
jgi:hypothetical protein